MKFKKDDVVLHEGKIRSIVEVRNGCYNVGNRGSCTMNVLEEDIKLYPFDGYKQKCPGWSCNEVHAVKVSDEFYCPNPKCLHRKKYWRGEEDKSYKLIATPYGLISVSSLFSAVGNCRCFPFRDRKKYPDDTYNPSGLVPLTSIVTSAMLKTFGIADCVDKIFDADLSDEKKVFYHRVCRALKHFEFYYRGLRTEWEWNRILKELQLKDKHCFWLYFEERTEADDIEFELEPYLPLIDVECREGKYKEVFRRKATLESDVEGVAKILRDKDADLLRREFSNELYIKLHNRDLGKKARRLAWESFKLEGRK